MVESIKWLFYLSHLVVSCHQVLNCLSIYGGYLLDVCALLLINVHMIAFSYKTQSGHSYIAIAVAMVCYKYVRHSVNAGTWSDSACS